MSTLQNLTKAASRKASSPQHREKKQKGLEQENKVCTSPIWSSSLKPDKLVQGARVCKVRGHQWLGSGILSFYVFAVDG